MQSLRTIGVMGSGTKSWAYLTEPLGLELARRPVNLLTGGGNGVMKTVSRAFTSVADRQGLAIGCIPCTPDAEGHFIPHNNYPNPYIELPVYTPLGVYDPEAPDKISRNHLNILSSDFVIALPGLGGTRNEIALAEKFNKPFVLYGPEPEFADLPAFMVRAENIDRVMKWVDTALDI